MLKSPALTHQTMTKFPIIIALAAALSLAACSSFRKDKDETAQEEKPPEPLFSVETPPSNRGALEVPPDLLATSNRRVRATQQQEPGGGYEVLPQVVGAEIQSDGERSWLEIDADAGVVWRKLSEFWAFEEIDLVEFRPKAGVMETDWFAKKDSAGSGAGAVARELFAALTNRNTSLDKFTLRLERDGGGTRLFVSHRAREKIAKAPDSPRDLTLFDWVERDGDAEKEAQMLQTLVLLFDTTDDSTDESSNAADGGASGDGDSA